MLDFTFIFVLFIYILFLSVRIGQAYGWAVFVMSLATYVSKFSDCLRYGHAQLNINTHVKSYT